jgi:hypothetical protein
VPRLNRSGGSTLFGSALAAGAGPRVSTSLSGEMGGILLPL